MFTLEQIATTCKYDKPNLLPNVSFGVRHGDITKAGSQINQVVIPVCRAVRGNLDIVGRYLVNRSDIAKYCTYLPGKEEDNDHT